MPPLSGFSVPEELSPSLSRYLHRIHSCTPQATATAGVATAKKGKLMIAARLTLNRFINLLIL